MIGVAIFILAYLIIAFASFRHHFITGLVSLVPVANLIILPTVWHKTAKIFIASIISISLASAAWFSGANQHIAQLAQNFTGQKSHIIKTNYQANSTHSNQTEPTQVISHTPTDLKKVSLFNHYKQPPLPNKALYYLLFKQVNRQDWEYLKDSLIRITFEDETQVEGRVSKILPDRLVIKFHQNQKTQIFETSTNRIIQVEKLIKQPST